MNSIFSLLLVAMMKRITDMVPEIRWIDQDFGQLGHYEERPPVSFPCVLIDFNQTTYEQEFMQVQMGLLNINIRLAFAPFSNSSAITPEYVQQKALQFYEIEMRLYQALQGWNPDSDICQPLVRISASNERREDPLRVRTLVFTTAFEDNSAQKVYTKVPRPALVEEYYKTV